MTRPTPRRALRPVLAVLLPLALVAAAAGAAGTSRDRDDTPPPAGAGRVLVAELSGPVTPVMAEALDAAIARAHSRGYEALVIEMDTPGGLETSMREMVQSLLASPVPVIGWVAPAGAHAASAGVFIIMACDVAAMAPGTNIGAATPINMQGPMDSTLARKATNDASAFARTVAAQRGRNVAWAERAVREAVSASETEAVEADVVDFVAHERTELLRLADGRTWKRGDDERTLHVAGLPLDELAIGFRQKLLALLADPNIAYLLLMLGFYGLLFELQNPGAILPGVVGGICLVLAFLALSTLPVNYAGVALLVLAVAFFLAEVKVASHGLLAAGGVVAMLLGSIILFRGEGVVLSWTVILGTTAVTAAFFLVLVGAGLRAQKRKVQTGAGGLVGERAEVVERLAPGGRVRLGDTSWSALSDVPVDVGAMVEITGVDGLTLRVRPWPKEERS